MFFFMNRYLISKIQWKRGGERQREGKQHEKMRSFLKGITQSAMPNIITYKSFQMGPVTKTFISQSSTLIFKKLLESGRKMNK